MSLIIRVQFLAAYSGKEWPPSPARLFKAFVNAASAGWATERRAELHEALHALEGSSQTSPPTISAPGVSLKVAEHRRFVPNNSINWPTERKLNPQKGIDLEPEPIRSWEIASPATVWYSWPELPHELANTLRPIARRISSIGKGEDFAVVDVVGDPPSAKAITWVATEDLAADVALEVPENGCLDVCTANFQRPVNSRPLPITGVRSVRYAHDSLDEGANPPTKVLALWAGGRRRSWDGRMLRQVVGAVRRLLEEVRGEVVDMLARNESDRARVEALAQRVLLGKDEKGASVREPHLAVLPIPSVRGPYPDGRIRRLALVGFGCFGPERRAIFDLAFILLQGRELRDNGVGEGVTLEAETASLWLTNITCKSETWVSVTPIVQVARELTSAEWRRLKSARKSAPNSAEELARLEQRLQARRMELIYRSLQQAVDLSSAQVAGVELVPSGAIAGVHLASQYRVAGYLASTPRFHLRVCFDRPISGPIAIGRGRHVGFGLMWPDHGNG